MKNKRQGIKITSKTIDFSIAGSANIGIFEVIEEKPEEISEL